MTKTRLQRHSSSLYKTILAILIISASAKVVDSEDRNPLHLQVTEGCASNIRGFCYVCFKRKLRHLRCAEKQPESDPCNFYVGIRNSCMGCKRKYALRPTDEEGEGICVPGTIEKCQIEVVSEVDQRHRCYACESGYYADGDYDNRSCVPAYDIDNTVENCKWGGITVKGFGTECARCIDGYSLTYDFRRCVRSELHGCLLLEVGEQVCRECDVYRGWSMQANRKCVRVYDSDDQ